MTTVPDVSRVPQELLFLPRWLAVPRSAKAAAAAVRTMAEFIGTTQMMGECCVGVVVRGAEE